MGDKLEFQQDECDHFEFPQDIRGITSQNEYINAVSHVN